MFYRKLLKLQGLPSSAYIAPTVIDAAAARDEQVAAAQSKIKSGIGLTCLQNRGNADDRFIPKRRGVNLDLSRYIHMNDEDNEKDGIHLDVLKEVSHFFFFSSSSSFFAIE